MIVTVDLPENYVEAMEDLMLSSNMNQDQIFRAALRLYQYVGNRVKVGEEMVFMKDGTVVPRASICGSLYREED